MKKVKVRIAVVVTGDGSWNSCGWDKGEDDEMMSSALDIMDDGERRYWLEAEIELPLPAETVAATVKEG